MTRKTIPHLLMLALVAGAAWWVHAHRQDVLASLTFSWIHVIALLPLVVCTVLVIGLLNQLIIDHFGLRLRFGQWAALGFASTLANYVLPLRAGMALRAAYLKRCHDFPMNRFGSSMVFIYVTTLLCNSAIGLFLLARAWRHGDDFQWPLACCFLVFFAISLSALFVSPRSSEETRVSAIGEYLVKIRRGWQDLKQSRPLLAKVAIATIANTALAAVRFQIAYAATGHWVNMADCLLVSALATLSVFISITPASLGIKEAAIVFASTAINLPPEVGLLAAAVDRAAAIAVVFVLGIPCSLRISREVSQGSMVSSLPQQA